MRYSPRTNYIKKIKIPINIVILIFLIGTISWSSERLNINFAHIGPNAIGMPFNKILLISKGKIYFALKYTKGWKGEKEGEWYSKYEIFCQDDGSGDFLKGNVKYKTGELSDLQPLRIIGRLVIWRESRNINFLNLSTWWSTNGKINWTYFKNEKKADKEAIKLSPTNWNNIKDVDVFSNKLKWFNYDENRKDFQIQLN